MSTSSEIRATLDHPVIDADGHTLEFMPAVREYLKDVAGGEVAAKLYRSPRGIPIPFSWYRNSPEERLAARRMRPAWWGVPAENTLDRTTAMLPKLMYDRLDECGVDYSIVYPTIGLFALGTPIEEARLSLCRAINNYHADVFGPFQDRLCPVAVIPMHTPEEAIAELDHAVGTLGYKAILMAGHVERPVEAAGPANRLATWIDHLGIDSQYDYDPVWQRCLDLKVAPAFHSGGMGWGSRNSVNNYMFNHIGHFAAAGEATCKSLFMAGVTNRFPDLRFAFLEGGTAWAVNLYNDLIGHWSKRNRDSVHLYDPRRLDIDRMESLFREHGDKVLDRLDTDSLRDQLAPFAENEEDDAMIDEWAAIGIDRAEDIRDRFVPSFYFGCEADDPMNAMAFDSRLNGFDVKLRAIFSSDVGHWDVPDMAEVLEEAHELLEHELLDAADFRDFVFANSAHLYADLNPDFFKGTVVEDACKREVGLAA
jgi:predicted TIM-barrel fold metal-dependent hydrolase